MSHMWNVGDKAVCIEASHKDPKGSDIPIVGRVYTVTGVLAFKDRIGLVFEGMALCGGYKAYVAERFRPIVKADDDFIAQMRALKPKVKQ